MILRQSTSVTIRLGPFVDSLDGVTPEAAITWGGLDQFEILKADGVSEGAVTNTPVAVTGADGWYDLVLTTTETNTVGDLTVVAQDSSVFLPVFKCFQVVEEAVYDALYAASATFAVDVASISGSATAADNLELVYDGVEAFHGPYSGPHGQGVYLNGAAGNTNTVNGVDGTWSNAVSTIAAAKTLADSLAIHRIYITHGTAITLAASMPDYEFIGVGEVLSNSVDLGSQNVDLSEFRNLIVEGVQGGSQRLQIVDGAIRDATPTTLNVYARNTGFVDQFEVDTSNDNVFDQCFSLVAGSGRPNVIATGAAGTMAFRHYSGGIEFQSLSSSHNVSVEADGQVVFNANCNVNAAVSLRGCMTVTDNTSGMTNLTENAAINRSTISDTVWTEPIADHSGVVGSTAEALDGAVSLDAQAIRDAMKLAPAVGAPAAGSVDEHLDTIESRVDVATSTRATQADILSDATPFAGANIDATISSVASAVSSVSSAIAALNDVSTADLAAAIAADPGLIRVIERTTNRCSLNPANGVVTVYDDAGVSSLTGLAYSDIAQTALYDGTAPVVSVTRLT